MKKRFSAELIEGHKGVVCAIVPFDPEAAFRCKPTRLAGRRHGWPVRGAVNGVPFDGYVGERWGRFFVALDAGLREVARVGAGDVVAIDLMPTSDAAVVATAVAQSAITTQPARARADAVVPPTSTPAKPRRTR